MSGADETRVELNHDSTRQHFQRGKYTKNTATETTSSNMGGVMRPQKRVGQWMETNIVLTTHSFSEATEVDRAGTVYKTAAFM